MVASKHHGSLQIVFGVLVILVGLVTFLYLVKEDILSSSIGVGFWFIWTMLSYVLILHPGIQNVT